LFGVSEMTVRRDVSGLVRFGKLRGFHGGIGSLSPEDMLGSDYADRDLAMADAKRAIAARATEFVREDSVIAIDAGTTAIRMTSVLPRDKRLHVVTQSFPVVSALVGSADTEVICLGGVLHRETLSFDGVSTLAAKKNVST